MNVPEQVARLIETFDRNIEAYKHHDYNETQLRHEFLDPFFMALGWDVNNTEGLAEAYKDVIHEDSIRIGSATKAPDYCFRIGGTRKFFVEAKKPSVSIKDAPHPAFQLRRYAWSAKLPLSILTDFEEFAVYDCRVRPVKADRSSAARIKYIKYTEYPDRWDEIASVFSKDAILKGSFDKYAKSARRKKGTAEVDTAFLNEIETWRDIIAHNIAVRNPSLTNRQLNFAVQRTIDRIIFLRIAEDRGVEQYGQLLRQTTGHDTYKRLCTRFERADERYNSGLFHFSPEPNRPEPPDDLTLNLTIDDKPLKEIIKSLYYPDSPYEFAVLPAEILGQIYEQFLGKVITLTKGHRAKIEDKPEVKKAGGVYYTPSYIVDYIVKNTVGKLLENKTPIAAAKLKILDPACGSGSFLIAAYQYLLDWHLKYYTDNNPAKHTKGRNPKLYQTDKGEYHLTIAERKRIVLNNIFGVDIDSQAVEVTKLSLLLKILEGETKLVLFHKERALPDLGNNIKCGNSLIGPDFYEGKQLTMFDEEERYRINVFDWKKEFSQILNRKNPGFDAVIGNPPYIDSEWMTRYLPDQRIYCPSRYQAASGNWDIFCIFIEKALSLCKLNGYSSMIVPNKLGSASYAAAVRGLLAVNNKIISICDYSRIPVFPVAVYPIVYVAQHTPPKKTSSVRYIRIAHSENRQIFCSESHNLNYSRYFSKPDHPWQIFSSIGGPNPSERIRSSFPPLNTIAEVLGAATVSEAYIIKPLIKEYSSDIDANLKMVNSGTIDRYHFLWKEKPFRYIKTSYLRPVIPAHLEKQLPSKRLKQAKLPKIIVAGMTKKLECAIDVKGEFLAGKSTAIIFSSLNLKFLLGLLNSKLISFYYRTIFGGNTLQGGYLQIGTRQLRTLPIPNIDHSDPKDKNHHDRMVSLVQTMLDLNKQLAKAKTSHEKTALKRQIDATDRQIDNLVYQLYNLTEEEIAIVEEMKSK